MCVIKVNENLYAITAGESKRSEISLGIKIHPDLWNQEAGIAKGNTIEARNINSVIDRVKAKLRAVYDQLCTQHDYVSAAMVKEAYHNKKKPEESKSLLEAINLAVIPRGMEAYFRL